MAFKLIMPGEMAGHIAASVRARRLARNWTQRTLSARAGVSYAVIKQFEQTGKIALHALLKLALALGALDDFQGLFQPPPLEQALTLDAVLKDHTRQRGRR